MSRLFKRKFKFKLIHLQAVLVIVIYNILSKSNLAYALTKDMVTVTFLNMYVFGILATCVFLYFFSHENFFQFAKDIESLEKKQEDKYIKKFKHHGKILGTMLIGGLGGPILLALTLRLLFEKSSARYALMFTTLFVSTFVTVGLTKGIPDIILLCQSCQK